MFSLDATMFSLDDDSSMSIMTLEKSRRSGVRRRPVSVRSEPLEVNPTMFLSLSLQNRGIKGRIDSFSVDQALYYEPYAESDIPVHVLRALREENLEELGSLCTTILSKRNQFGETLVHLACRMGKASALQYLVKEKNLPLNVRDKIGRNPLHNACFGALPNFTIIQFLLERAPRLVLFEDDHEKTPFDYIPKRNFSQWTRYIAEQNVLKQLETNFEDGTDFRSLNSKSVLNQHETNFEGDIDCQLSSPIL